MGAAAAAVVMGALSAATLGAEEEAWIREIAPAGVTLFARNIVDADQLKALTSSLQNLRPRTASPFIIAIDQEGGRVARLKAPFPNLGPALYLVGGQTDAAAQEFIFRYGAEVGASLRALGVNVNFAPVLDVKQKDTHESIGDRAFSQDPLGVGLRAGAFLRGMHSVGVLGCLKHFPGQGSARSDTHHQQARVEKSLAELQALDLVPFATLLPEAAMVMLAHCIYPCLDEREASLSRVVVETLLREQLKFAGVAVSDDMTMAAVHNSAVVFGDQAVAAIESGIDLLLICKDLGLWRQAHQALSHEAKNSPAFKKRLEQAADRVTTLRARLLSAK